MRTVDLRKPGEFEWIQSGKTENGYLLRHREGPAGELIFRQFRDSSATGETGFGQWSFSRTGVWKGRYAARDLGTKRERATFQPSGGASEGVITLSDGRKYRWGIRGLFSGVHSLLDDQGREILILARGLREFRWSDFFKDQARIETSPHAEDPETLSLLLLFTWWLMLLEQEESASAAAVVAAMG